MFLKSITAFLFLAGLFFAIFGVYFIALGYEAEGWTSVEGKVLSAVVEVDITMPVTTHGSSTRTQRANQYYPSITYTWTVGEETFTGNRYRLGETHEKFFERAEAAVAANKYRRGMPITVYYNSDHPDQAVLDPSLSVGVFVPLPMGLLFLACAWALHRFRPALEKVMAAQSPARTDRLSMDRRE